MYMHRIWVFNGMLNCRSSFVKVCQKSQASNTEIVTFRSVGCSSNNVVQDRYLWTCNRHIDHTVNSIINGGLLLQNRLYFSRSCCSFLHSKIQHLLSRNHIKNSRIKGGVKVKDVLNAQCNRLNNVYCMSTTAGTDPHYVMVAKEIIEDAKKINVMAGAVPLTKVVTLLKDLHGQEFQLDELMHVLSQQLLLLQEAENVSPLTELLLSHGLKHNVVIHFLENLPLDHGNITLQNLQKIADDSLKHLRMTGFTERNLNSFLMSAPDILFIDSKAINRVLAKLKGLFTAEDAICVINNSPSVLCDPWKDTNMKFDYAYFTMGYKQKEILTSHLFEHTLEHIEDRHLFLVRAGFFKPVREKDDPRLNPNPPLGEVINTADKVFAKLFGGFSLEEYRVYLEMREVEREEESNRSDFEDETDEDDDDEEEVEEEENKKGKENKLKRK